MKLYESFDLLGMSPGRVDVLEYVVIFFIESYLLFTFRATVPQMLSKPVALGGAQQALPRSLAA